MEKKSCFGRRPYETPESEEIVMVEKWDVMTDPSTGNVAVAESDEWGEIGG